MELYALMVLYFCLSEYGGGRGCKIFAKVEEQGMLKYSKIFSLLFTWRDV
jgi:hypothetical protein